MSDTHTIPRETPAVYAHAHGRCPDFRGIPDCQLTLLELDSAMAHHGIQVFSTAYHVWTSRDRLGYGATGSVYIGHNRVRIRTLQSLVESIS